MQIKRTELKEALEIVKPGLASKEIIEQSTSFAFMGDKVVTYNDKISMSHPVKGLDITGAVKADEMYQLLSKLKADEMSLEVQDNEIIIKAGKSTAGLMLAGEITLPLDQIDEIDKMLPIPDGFLEGIRLAVQSCARDMSREVLTEEFEIKFWNSVTSSDTFRYFNLTRLFSFMYKDVYLNFKKNEKSIIR